MISILLVESHTAVREAFAIALSAQEGIHVVATASTTREAVNLAWVHQPAITIVSMQAHNDSGFRLVEQLRISVPHCRTIMLAPDYVPGYMRRAYDQGVWAYLSENLSLAEIVHDIRMVDAGKHLIDPNMADHVVKSPLTPRETDVLRMVYSMGTTSEIAKHMHLSQGTINNYISSILAKLGVSSRVQALIVAWNNGWL